MPQPTVSSTAGRTNVTSLQSHILQGEASAPGSTGDFTWILSALSLAAKAISHKVRMARIEDVLGDHLGPSNIHGETQQKLDVIANDILMECLGNRPAVALVASEEDDEPTLLRRGADGGKYCVVFDPLDGSSNLDVSVGVGTIFSILRNDPSVHDAVQTLCQCGTKQVAAGYVLYGSSTVFVITTGRGVDMFVLDPTIGSFVLVKAQVTIPRTGKIYSVNEANSRTFPEGFSRYLDWAHGEGYSSRYIGSMVADVHRTLLKGGIFLYPPTISHPKGKLRLLYEANPIAFLAEQAGGLATDGKQRILDIQPDSLHQRTPLIVGSREEVELLQKFVNQD